MLNEITASFGPSIEEISIKQDVYRTKGGQLPAVLSFLALSAEQVVSTTTPAGEGFDSSVHVVATTPVPAQNLRIHLGHTLVLPWLQELKIVFRTSTNGPAGFLSMALAGCAPSMSSTPTETIPNSGKPSSGIRGAEVVDLSPCTTLETLWIEDLDHTGQPHQLRSVRRLDETGCAVQPFNQHQGLRLPPQLITLKLLGFSAGRFNFGWLKATPRLEQLQVLGMRYSIDPRIEEDQESLWQWEGVSLPRLKHMVVHHAPAHHFRFEILHQCLQLETLDVREVSWTALRNSREGLQFAATTINMDLTVCRLEILPSKRLDPSTLLSGLRRVLQSHLANTVHLHLDGVPIPLLIELTSGPARPFLQEQPAAAGMQRIERVLTRQRVNKQHVLDYDLVSSKGNEMGVPELQATSNNIDNGRTGQASIRQVHYRTLTKGWWRIVP
ncbi:hypothetical protein BGZ99_006350 [Dissophora globulifera]|uniref:Uncharacterized protein n=1 Tax=Dissophora globulifera TaxID=979702 RepID=A0A9P6URA1_9FUNG|nr:hypothetical protein BGZ99_006350 [Dissophora globulifera]